MSWQNVVLKAAKPFIKFIGKYFIRTTNPAIDGVFYYENRHKIKAGDIILSSTKGHISNIFNPSEIKHGAVFVSGQDVKYVVEALGDGVVETDLVTHLTTKDIVVVVRPKFHVDFDALEMFTMVSIGRPYDYEFENDDEYYCFELIIAALKTASIEKNFLKSKTLGHEYYSADSFLLDKRFETIIDSRRY